MLADQCGSFSSGFRELIVDTARDSSGIDSSMTDDYNGHSKQVHITDFSTSNRPFIVPFSAAVMLMETFAKLTRPDKYVWDASVIYDDPNLH